MVISCAVITCRNHNKNCDLSFYTFPTQRKICHSKEQERLIAMRQAMWRKACGYKKPISRSVRICGKHFVSGKPSRLDEPSNIDWVPSLHLPDQPSSNMLGGEAELLAAEKQMEDNTPLQNTICSIQNCPSNKKPGWNTKIYPFPKLDTTNYLRRVLSEKRLLLWCQMLDQSTQWNKVDLCKLQLCSLHFTSGTMADLTDVGNIDWIPTINMNKPLRIKDHIAFFDLHNLISLVKDSKTTGGCVTIESFSSPQTNTKPDNNNALEVEPKFAVQKVSVGLKCILCLSSTALKPLNQENRKAIDLLFKENIRVDSELICAMCSKAANDFSTFYQKILYMQEKATIQKKKPVAKTVQRIAQKRTADQTLASTPAEKKDRAANEKGQKLFSVLLSNDFQCKLCSATLATRTSLNDHLFLAHKVKICCKICKQSFSPEGYASHKPSCLEAYRAQRQAQNKIISFSSRSPVTQIAPKVVVPKESNEKHSCYICKEFYTPSEMISHVKTHGVDTVNQLDLMKDYEACKQCNKAIQKQNMSRHMEAHESHRNQLKKLIKDQEDKQRFQCSVCLLEFRTITLMEKHKEKHKLVTPDDKIECPDCKKIITAKYFKYHVMMIHENNEQLPCDKCGKLISRIALKAHRATTCSDDDLLSCEHCGKSMRAHLLKGHISKVHSTVSVKCSFCPKEYTSREYAIRHERWSHRTEWDKRKREGVKRLNLDRDQLEEVLGIKVNPNQEEGSATCPVCLNVHGTKSYIELHVRKVHPSEYLSMVMGGVIPSTGNNVLEDFDAAQYITEVLEETTT